MFSVIIPLYNKELSIANTIQSVLDQTFQDFEIVIVNDGSTDGSVEVVEQFIKDERIRLIHQQNQGVSAARNKGIEEAKYDWIALLDGDDLWKHNHLEEILKMMKLYPAEKIYVTSFEFSDKREMYRHPRSKTIFKIEDYFKEAIKEDLIWTSIVIINKECFQKIGGFNTTLVRGEDRDVWARLGSRYNIIKSIVVTAVYRIDAENRSDETPDVKRTFEGILNLKYSKSKYEYRYYKKFIIRKIKGSILRNDLRTLSYLLLKHHIKLLIPKYKKI